MLEELFRLKLCPLEPIYVANFGGSRDIDSDVECLSKSKQAAIEGEFLALLSFATYYLYLVHTMFGLVQIIVVNIAIFFIFDIKQKILN